MNKGFGNPMDWRDGKTNDDDRFSWPFLFSNMLWDIFLKRGRNQMVEFERAVMGLDIVLEGFKDEVFESESKKLDATLAKLKLDSNTTNKENDDYYIEEKARMLSRLIKRINEGTLKVKEYVNGGRWVMEIAKKLNNGVGQNIFITGKPGSGKSEGAIEAAYHIVDYTGGKFDEDTHIVFNPSQFSKLYENEELTPPGSVIIYDEAGVGSNSKDFLKGEHRSFAKLFQIIRHRSVCVIMTAPDLGMINSDLRKLLHWWVETRRIDRRNNVCISRVHIVDILQNTGKIIYPYPYYDGNQLREVRFEKLLSPKGDVYRKRAKEYKDDIAYNTRYEIDISEAANNFKRIEFQTYCEHRDKGIKQGDIIKSDGPVPMGQPKASKYEKAYKARKLID